MRFRSILESEFYKKLPEQGAEAAKNAGKWVLGNPLKSLAAVILAYLVSLGIINKLTFGFLCPLASQGNRSRDDWELQMIARLAEFATFPPAPWENMVEAVKQQNQKTSKQISDDVQKHSYVKVEFEVLEEDPDQVEVTVHLSNGFIGSMFYLLIQTTDFAELIDFQTWQEIDENKLQLYDTHWFRFYGIPSYVFKMPQLKFRSLSRSYSGESPDEILQKKQELNSRFVQWFQTLKQDVSGELGLPASNNVLTQKDIWVRERPEGGVIVYLTPSALGKGGNEQDHDEQTMRKAVHYKLLKSNVNDIYEDWLDEHEEKGLNSALEGGSKAEGAMVASSAVQEGS